MKEDLTNESLNDTKGRVIKMIPPYAVHTEPHSQYSLDVLNRNLEYLIARLDASTTDQALISVPSQIGTEYIREKDIVCCKACKNYTELSLRDGSTLMDSKGLYYYQNTLSDHLFFRTNRSWIVNLKMVRTILTREKELITTQGSRVPISESLIPQLKDRMLNLI